MDTIKNFFLTFDFYIFWIYFPFIILIWFLIFLYFLFKFFAKNKDVFENIIFSSYWIVLISGFFWKWKTRILTLIIKKIKEHFWKNYIIISNYDNDYTDVYYTSLLDLINILEEIEYIKDIENFNSKEKKEISEKFKNYFSKTQDFESYRWGKKTRFIIIWDEFHNYLYNLDTHFFQKKDGRRLMRILHMVRHMDTIMILSTQDSEELVLKLHRLAMYSIECYSYLSDLIFWAIFFRKNELKKYNESLPTYVPMGRGPALFFNFWRINDFVDFLNNFLNKIYSKVKKYDWEKIEFIKKIETLKYKSKFNVKNVKDIYETNTIIKLLKKSQK